MKSSLDVIRAVLADVAALPSTAPCVLPAGVVQGMARDLIAAQSASDAFDAYKERVAKMELRPNGGEEDVVVLHDVEGGAA